MQSTPVQTLLRDLKSEEREIRDHALQELQQLWMDQKGIVGLQMLHRAQSFLNTGDLGQAELLLTQLTQSMPNFAEAWHQRAILYFGAQRYRKSLSDCQQTIALNPFHFQAMHGLGLCHFQLKEYRAASQALRRALSLYPHDLESQRLLLECAAHL